MILESTSFGTTGLISTEGTTERVTTAGGTTAATTRRQTTHLKTTNVKTLPGKISFIFTRLTRFEKVIKVSHHSSKFY